MPRSLLRGFLLSIQFSPSEMPRTVQRPFRARPRRPDDPFLRPALIAVGPRRTDSGVRLRYGAPPSSTANRRPSSADCSTGRQTVDLLRCRFLDRVHPPTGTPKPPPAGIGGGSGRAGAGAGGRVAGVVAGAEGALDRVVCRVHSGDPVPHAAFLSQP